MQNREGNQPSGPAAGAATKALGGPSCPRRPRPNILNCDGGSSGMTPQRTVPVLAVALAVSAASLGGCSSPSGASGAVPNNAPPTDASLSGVAPSSPATASVGG